MRREGKKVRATNAEKNVRKTMDDGGGGRWRMDGRSDRETRVQGRGRKGLKRTNQASWKSMEAGRDCLRFPRCRLLARFFPQRMKFNYGETRVYRAYPLVSLFSPPPFLLFSRFSLSSSLFLSSSFCPFIYYFLFFFPCFFSSFSFFFLQNLSENCSVYRPPTIRLAASNRRAVRAAFSDAISGRRSFFLFSFFSLFFSPWFKGTKGEKKGK